ncbi:hypothetical protein [Bacillus subtilis]
MSRLTKPGPCATVFLYILFLVLFLVLFFPSHLESRF